jgi:hypothetical protein
MLGLRTTRTPKLHLCAVREVITRVCLVRCQKSSKISGEVITRVSFLCMPVGKSSKGCWGKDGAHDKK